MGIIQNALNQMLGTVGVAARLSPGYETRQELHKLGKQEKDLKAEKDIIVESIKKQRDAGNYNINKMETDADIAKEMATQVEKIRKKQFELKPSKASLEKYRKTKDLVKEGENLKQSIQNLKKAKQDLLQERQIAANRTVGDKQESKKSQKRNFKDYVGQLETSLGGTVSDLPESVQKAIAKQYTRGEKVKLMNKMDKESKK